MAIGSAFDSALLQNKTKFIKRCFRRIYIPFVVFALIFLFLHNLLSWAGIISHDSIYTWSEGNQNAWSIVWNMSGFDEDMCSPYWIFRALFLGSVSYLVIYSLCKKLSYFTDEKEVRWAVVTISALLLIWQVLSGVKVTGVDGGGYRELMTLFFIACGALYNIYMNELRINWIWALVLLAVLVGSYLLMPVRIEMQANIFETLKLLLPAVTAFLLIDAFVSLFKNDNGIIQQSLKYVGSRLMYVF
ncbi:MAG: acyltransferase family protein, partial [Bacteroidaceae bacterium]|nr:acyltransferase family protein [Bacteroidaceae bacterium]